MKILHCCLASFYIDNFGYQENVLPKMHKMQGHDVSILASTETYADKAVLGYVKPSRYETPEGIPIERIPYVGWLPHAVARKLRIYRGVAKALVEFAPDIIFLHDTQLWGREIIKYAKKHPDVKIYADCHTDYINSARGFFSKHILHKLIYRFYVSGFDPHLIRHYGTLPARCYFLTDMYKINPSKVELLPVGADLSEINLLDRISIRDKTRAELGLSSTDFVIATGGKIDSRKNIHLLLEVLREMKREDIKLILFGRPVPEMKVTIESLMSDCDKIRYTGWATPLQTSHYLLASDVAFYPGTHSTLWEQSIGLGIPCVFKRWKGIEHVDVGGNCLFIDDVSKQSIKDTISIMYENRQILKGMRECSESKGVRHFSYWEIAKRAIEHNNTNN